MKREERIALQARDVCNGNSISLTYRADGKVLNKRNYEKEQLIKTLEESYGKGTKAFESAFKEAKKSLPKMKEGGSNPSIELYKISTYDFVYDERDYFRQCREEQAQNLNPTKEPEYKKVQGILYEKIDTGELYIRFAIRADRLDTTAKYSSDKSGKNILKYEDIEEYLVKSARKGYESYNRQDGITSTGYRPEVLVRQVTLKVEKVLSLEIK